MDHLSPIYAIIQYLLPLRQWRFALPFILSIIVTTGSVGAKADTPDSDENYLQCVAYARATSGVRLYGDAHLWWGQADGRFPRGRIPRRGAVMAFKPFGIMSLGHVATVTRIVDHRHILIDHANWSPFNGHRGQIERNVRVEDVSDANNWSAVRVWYAPINALGATTYPLFGFIYGDGRLHDFTGNVPTWDHAHYFAQTLQQRRPTPRLAYARSILAVAEWRTDDIRTVTHRPMMRNSGRMMALQATIARLR
jgi:surface antigen